MNVPIDPRVPGAFWPVLPETLPSSPSVLPVNVTAPLSMVLKRPMSGAAAAGAQPTTTNAASHNSRRASSPWRVHFQTTAPALPAATTPVRRFAMDDGQLDQSQTRHDISKLRGQILRNSVNFLEKTSVIEKPLWPDSRGCAGRATRRSHAFSSALFVGVTSPSSADRGSGSAGFERTNSRLNSLFNSIYYSCVSPPSDSCGRSQSLNVYVLGELPGRIGDRLDQHERAIGIGEASVRSSIPILVHRRSFQG